MLDRADDVIGLHTADLTSDQFARQQRIFAQIFEIAASARVAHQIDAAHQHHVETLGPRLCTNHCTARMGDFRVPCGRKRKP